jgi:hypothetical protein
MQAGNTDDDLKKVQKQSNAYKNFFKYCVSIQSSIMTVFTAMYKDYMKILRIHVRDYVGNEKATDANSSAEGSDTTENNGANNNSGAANITDEQHNSFSDFEKAHPKGTYTKIKGSEYNFVMNSLPNDISIYTNKVVIINNIRYFIYTKARMVRKDSLEVYRISDQQQQGSTT